MVDDDFLQQENKHIKYSPCSISLIIIYHITIHYCSDPAFKDAIILVSNRSCDFALLVRGKKEGARKTGFHMISEEMQYSICNGHASICNGYDGFGY